MALSDSRLHSFDGESVDLAYKDYRDGGQHTTMTLTGEELVRRFLLHVLPKGFMRVRHFGFLANRCRATRLAQIRAALEAQPPQAAEAKEETAPFGGYHCPKCRKGRMQVAAHLAPQRRDPGGSTRSPPCPHPEPSLSGQAGPRPAIALSRNRRNRLVLAPKRRSTPPSEPPG